MATADFLGRGFAQPVGINSRGGLRQSAQAAKVQESIAIIIGTQHGQRVMRPTFGCNLGQLTFAPNSRATANLAQYYVEEGLRRWEPRIVVDRVIVENDHDQDRLLIQVTYRLKATNEPQNLVYPFYLEQP